MKRGDVWIGVVLLAAVALFAVPWLLGGTQTAEAAVARIQVNGELYRTVQLTEEVQEIEIRTERGYNRLKISEGGIEIVEADCPDQLCIGFGHVHTPGDTIVCLPNHMFIEIEPSDGQGVDVDGTAS
ncbi:NusG domain II-containing protein [Paenibacillus campinasensis]|uniref:NusG domain II-containing protein n=1 Tax=Paenibacillus campinasensis TaxID=66347 RepID=A0ABW9SXZ6_9BACL|nr:NusG domain II-containing protein [Paenibacillus campinasensis]MUG65186.1 NusG domain II-containing protein [Paenibacillus campinasensis]